MTADSFAGLPAGTSPQSRRGLLRALGIATILALFITLGWRGRPPTGIDSLDDVTYLALSQSLASGSYREIYSASAPLHRLYPPGYPAWLVFIRKSVGGQPERIRMANLALVALALGLTFLVARRVAGEAFAFSVLFLLAINHTLLGVGGSLLSEPLFIALVSGTLALVVCGPPKARWPVYLSIATALAAFMTRTAGIPVVLALGPWLLTRERRTGRALYAILSLLVVGGWIWYASGGTGGRIGANYADDLTGAAPAGAGGISVLAGRMWHNATYYLTQDLPFALGIPTIPGTVVDNVFWLVVIISCLSVGTLTMWRISRPAAAVLILYCGMLLGWPWPVFRLLAPIVPLCMIVLLLGFRDLTRRWGPRASAVLFGTMVLILVIGAVPGVLRRDARGRACARSNPPHAPDCYGPGMMSFISAVEYVRDRSDPQDVVLTTRGPSVYYLANRTTQPAEGIGAIPPAELPEALRGRGIRYVILTDRDRGGKPSLAMLLLPACRGLRIGEIFSGTTLVLSVEAPTSPQEDACPVLRGWTSPELR